MFLIYFGLLLFATVVAKLGEVVAAVTSSDVVVGNIELDGYVAKA